MPSGRRRAIPVRARGRSARTRAGCHAATPWCGLSALRHSANGAARGRAPSAETRARASREAPRALPRGSICRTFGCRSRSRCFRRYDGMRSRIPLMQLREQRLLVPAKEEMDVRARIHRHDRPIAMPCPKVRAVLNDAVGVRRPVPERRITGMEELVHVLELLGTYFVRGSPVGTFERRQKLVHAHPCPVRAAEKVRALGDPQMRVRRADPLAAAVDDHHHVHQASYVKIQRVDAITIPHEPWLEKPPPPRSGGGWI